MSRSAVILLSLLCGCASQTESSGSVSARPVTDAGSDVSADVATQWDITPQLDSGTSCLGPTPGLDSDGDGLLDVVEDRNLNCRVDEGETDPQNADTDADGLTDADEDVDRNGRVDLERGETSPVLNDTDGNGISDGEEPLNEVCRASVIGETVRSRITLNSGRILSISPSWSPSQMLGPVDAAFVTGPEEQAAAWFALPDGEGIPFLGQLLDEWRNDAESGLPLFTAAGDSSGIWAWEFEVYAPDSPTEWLSNLLGAAGFTPMQASERTDAELPSEQAGRQGLATLTVRAEYQPASVTGADADRVLLAVVQDAALLDDWLLVTGVSRMAPTVDATIEAVCESLTPGPADGANFVLVSDTRAESRELLESVARALSSTMGASPVHLVPADMHLTLGNSGLPGPALTSFTEIPNLVAGWVPQSDDQRLWLNALAALALLNFPDDSSETILVLISAFEDTEFHVGVTGGRDGDAGQPMLPDGEDRDALVSYYADTIAALGVSLVTVSPAATFDAPGCGTIASPGLTEALSFQSVARATGGAWVNGCADAASGVLPRSLAGFAPTRAHYALGPNVLSASALGADTLPLAWLPRVQTADVLEVSARAPVDEVQHVAYLRWVF